MFLPPSNLADFGGSYFLFYSKQKAENCTACSNNINHLCQLLNSICAYRNTFYGLTHMLTSKNANNDVSKDSGNDKTWYWNDQTWGLKQLT